MSNQADPEKRTTIEQLEKLLSQDDEVEIEILPNGEVRMKPSGVDVSPKKPLTFRDSLGKVRRICGFCVTVYPEYSLNGQSRYHAFVRINACEGRKSDTSTFLIELE